MLPAPAILAAFQMFQSLASAQMNSEAAQAKHTEEMARIELQRHVETLRLELERERTQAQKEILLKLIDMAQHVFDRKMDFFVQGTQHFQQLITAHQEALITEKREIKNKFLGGELADNAMLPLLSRQREIDAELSDLEKIAAQIKRETDEIVAALKPEIPPQASAFLG